MTLCVISFLVYSYDNKIMYYITEVVGICISRYRNTDRLLKMYIKFLGNTRNPKLKGVCAGGGGVQGGFVRNVCTTM